MDLVSNPITPIYAALIALLFVALSVRTLRLRHRFSVAVGTGGERELERAIRAHANCAEYVPIALLLVYFLEATTDLSVWIHVLGASLLIGRLVHAYGISQVRENFAFRIFGMATTFTVIVGAAAALLIAPLLSG